MGGGTASGSLSGFANSCSCRVKESAFWMMAARGQSCSLSWLFCGYNQHLTSDQRCSALPCTYCAHSLVGLGIWPSGCGHHLFFAKTDTSPPLKPDKVSCKGRPLWYPSRSPSLIHLMETPFDLLCSGFVELLGHQFCTSMQPLLAGSDGKRGEGWWRNWVRR